MRGHGAAAARSTLRGLVDESAGYHARRTAWWWSAGVGTLATGEPVAWNLVDGVHDAPVASERTVWVAASRARCRRSASTGSPASASCASRAEATRARRERLLVMASDYEQPFGAFTGAAARRRRAARGLGRDGAPCRRLVSSRASARRPSRGPTTRAWTRSCSREGDRRNVADRYRYWRLEAIVADLDARRHPFHVAVENWQHDLNIGAVVRNANAFLAAEVHIVGDAALEPPRRDGHRPLPARPPPPDAGGLRATGRAARSCPVLGVDNLPGSVADRRLRRCRARCVLLFGQEGPGALGRRRARCRRPCSRSAVRLDPLDQRGGRERGRDARVDPPPRARAGASSVAACSRPARSLPVPLQTLGWITRPGPFMERCRDRYGDAFTLRIASEGTWVMLSDPAAVKQVFTGDPRLLHAGEAQRDPAPDPRPELGAAARRARRTWPSASCCCRRSTASG